MVIDLAFICDIDCAILKCIIDWFRFSSLSSTEAIIQEGSIMITWIHMGLNHWALIIDLLNCILCNNICNLLIIKINTVILDCNSLSSYVSKLRHIHIISISVSSYASGQCITRYVRSIWVVTNALSFKLICIVLLLVGINFDGLFFFMFILIITKWSMILLVSNSWSVS